MVTVDKNKSGKWIWRINGKIAGKKVAHKHAVTEYNALIEDYIHQRITPGNLKMRVQYHLKWSDGSGEFKTIEQNVSSYNRKFIQALMEKFSEVSIVSVWSGNTRLNVAIKNRWDEIEYKGDDTI